MTRFSIILHNHTAAFHPHEVFMRLTVSSSVTRMNGLMACFHSNLPLRTCRSRLQLRENAAASTFFWMFEIGPARHDGTWCHHLIWSMLKKEFLRCDWGSWSREQQWHHVVSHNTCRSDSCSWNWSPAFAFIQFRNVWLSTKMAVGKREVNVLLISSVVLFSIYSSVLTVHFEENCTWISYYQVKWQ